MATYVLENNTGGDQLPSYSMPKDLPNSHDQLYGNALVEGLQKQRHNFCDITLRVGGTSIKAHKIILAASSSYFAALFNENMREGRQAAIELIDLDGEVVSALVDSLYNGGIQITTQNVQNLLETAKFLDNTWVCRACCQFMKERIDVECCVAVLQLANQLGEKELTDSALKFFHNNFLKVTESADFPKLKPEFLEQLLIREDLCLLAESSPLPMIPARQEAKLARLVIKYVQADPVTRSQHIIPLLSAVRLPLLSAEDMEALLGELDKCLGAESTMYAEALELVEKARGTQVRDLTDTTAPPWSRPRQFVGLAYFFSDRYPAYPTTREGRMITDFNDERTARGSRIVGMKVCTRGWVDNIPPYDSVPIVVAIRVSYSNGSNVEHGDVSVPAEVQEFQLEDDEYISKVALKCGWMIDRLSFTSNKGRIFGPYGGGGGDYHEVNNPALEPNSFLAYISGTVADTQDARTITNLKFNWGAYVYETKTRS